ncbi:MAG: hypothetical protein Q8K50_06590 [Hydrogenophaga sp.]|nr:hypothetical protein [Hydrogenophaga sp.]
MTHTEGSHFVFATLKKTGATAFCSIKSQANKRPKRHTDKVIENSTPEKWEVNVLAPHVQLGNRRQTAFSQPKTPQKLGALRGFF